MKKDKVVEAFHEGRCEGIRGANVFVTDGKYLYYSVGRGKRNYKKISRRVASVLFGSFFSSPNYVGIYMSSKPNNFNIINRMRSAIDQSIMTKNFVRDPEGTLLTLRNYDAALTALENSGEFDEEEDEVKSMREKILRSVKIFGMEYRFIVGE